MESGNSSLTSLTSSVFSEMCVCTGRSSSRWILDKECMASDVHAGAKRGVRMGDTISCVGSISLM